MKLDARELYLFIPFWKLKVMKKGVKTSYKKKTEHQYNPILGL